ncbi:unnamed protein product [Nippostrongylus brasiliensis]|uniref:1-acyl-sn-glycerol-3-phosphate acyltransferase epsilon (inferred by orthology to a human protein) n=1 Tax=Nippostrongylus brasiliensis TaxID=27835 RepID=A0A0N4XP53_NIPBR|nr:unnamed protein product [Nippostrongylus brasiliensis]
MLAFRQGIDGSEAGFRVMVKHHGYIYVRRFGEFLSAPVLKQLAWLDSLDEKFWLLVFPEGTRYSVKRPENIELSREFCRRKGIPELKNVLCPRAGGIFMALERLETLDAVYDVTIGYGQTSKELVNTYLKVPYVSAVVAVALGFRAVSDELKVAVKI